MDHFKWRDLVMNNGNRKMISFDLTPDSNDTSNIVPGGSNNNHILGDGFNTIGGMNPALNPLGFYKTGPLGSLLGATGLMGSGQKAGGGGGGPDYMAQAMATVKAAEISAGAARDVARSGLRAAELQANAGVQSSQNAAMGGIIGAALGAHTTTEQIKQWLPHEAGAATIQSWDLAQKWNKTLEMRTAGYQDTAINYELNGKNYRSLYSDSQWNALQMAEMTKRDMLQSVQTFGVKSASNPFGIDMSESDWLEVHSFKNPDELLKVDPQVAQQRNQQFDAWKEQMRKEGKGILVDLYENPQFAGSSILTAKGKDPLLDPSLVPLMEAMGQGTGAGSLQSQMDQELAEIDRMAPQWKNTSANTDPNKGFFFDANGNMITEQTQGGHKLSARDAYDFQMDKINKEKDAIRRKYQSLISEEGKRSKKWDEAVNALSKGEENPMTKEIKWAMEQGIVDKYGMINADMLMKHIPPSLLEAPQFNIYRDMSPQERTKLMDQYKKYTEMNVDPKLVQETNMGMGVTRKRKLNADGTIAAEAIEGYMTNAMGEDVYVSMSGSRLQEWYDRQSMIAGMGPLFPGMMAPVTNEDLAGTLTPHADQNMLAKPNQGMKGPSNKPKQGAAPKMESMINASATSPAPSLSAPKPKTGGSATPAGYSGAPLASGG